MKIDIRAMNEFLPFYISGIIRATLATCEACALGRQLTDEEIDELSEEVAGKTYWFMRGYKTMLKRAGETISEEEYSRLYQGIFDDVFNNAWALITLATEEIKTKGQKHQ